jgi:hypothetical protein
MTVKKLWCVVSFIVFLINFYGCTMMGFMVGSEIDKQEMIFNAGSSNKLAEITDSTQLKIKLNNGRVLTGTIQGINSVDSSAYCQRYYAFQSETGHNKLFPVINDTIILVGNSKQTTLTRNTKYQFSGFDFIDIRLRSLVDNSVNDENLNSLYYVTDQQNHKFSALNFKKYLERGLVPLQSEFIIQSAGEIQIIPVQKVSKIELPNSLSDRVLLTLIGFSADVLLYLWLEYIKSMRRFVSD